MNTAVARFQMLDNKIKELLYEIHVNNRKEIPFPYTFNTHNLENYLQQNHEQDNKEARAC
ncbi:MAG: hypothetical protein QM642_07785 [Edaphocola sp.]